MALNINGTTGISGVDGSASAPAVTGTDSNTGINFASDTVNINTGGVTRAIVNSAGDLGLGVSPTNFATYTTLDLKGPSGQGSAIRLQDNSDTPNTDDFVIYKNSSSAYLRVNGSDPLIAYLNGAERMRVTQNANGSSALYVNQTSEVSGANSHIVVNNSIACVSGSNYRSMYMSGNGALHWWNGTNQPFISTGGTFTDASDVSLKKEESDDD